MASGSGDVFHTNTLTLQVDTACIATLCANYVPPSPAPSPSPSPPPFDPNAPPVYPECINAKLLANPCPLGKRCASDAFAMHTTQACSLVAVASAGVPT